MATEWTKYRKRPVVIEAVQWHKGDPAPEGVQENALGVPFIETLEGTMHVSDRDYVIRGVKGELYPCKPAIFEASYERVESPLDGHRMKPPEALALVDEALAMAEASRCFTQLEYRRLRAAMRVLRESADGR